MLAFLYKLHYTLHRPYMWGIDRWGQGLIGGVALVWFFDCFVGFYLTLPRKHRRAGGGVLVTGEPMERSQPNWWRDWRKAWAVRWRQGGSRRIFDLHRAGGQIGRASCRERVCQFV